MKPPASTGPVITKVPITTAAKPAMTAAQASAQVKQVMRPTVLPPIQTSEAGTKGNSLDEQNFLFVGDSGTHKTVMLGSFPKLFIYDFDKGLRTDNIGKRTPHIVFRDAPKGMPVSRLRTQSEGLYEYGEAWPRFFEHINTIGAHIDAGTCPFESIGLDSLTFMSQIAMNHILKSNEWLVPNQGAYGSQQEYIKRIIGPLVVWPVRLVCTAHIQRDMNDITGTVEQLPLLTGKLAGLISAYFDEVYYLQTEGEGTSRRWHVLSEPKPNMRQVKSRCNVPNKTAATWEAIKPFIEPAT